MFIGFTVAFYAAFNFITKPSTFLTVIRTLGLVCRFGTCIFAVLFGPETTSSTERQTVDSEGGLDLAASGEGRTVMVLRPLVGV